jgi:integrating conjugative element protein (TIGR03759 family)
MAANSTITAVAVATVLATIGFVAEAQERATRSDTTISKTLETELSASEVARAQVWSLNEAEWRRYRHLMQGIRGSVSAATLSPIEVLGIHARDAAERRQYAERWAKAMHEDAERILKFQHAYDEAAERLYPGQTLIDVARLHGGPAPVTDLVRSDRILLRVTLDCPSCNAALARALSRLDDVAGLDIYVIDATESEQASIREWARAQGIEPDWVRSRRVTLNIDKASAGEQDGSESPPTFYIKRGELIERLAYAAL